MESGIVQWILGSPNYVGVLSWGSLKSGLDFWESMLGSPYLQESPHLFPKGPKYLYGRKYGFCSSNFPYGLGKYSLYGYFGPFGVCR